MTYMFNCGPVVFLAHTAYSKIDYGYPNLFVKAPDDSCLNVDLTIGRIFGMKREDWDSWFDRDLVNLGTFNQAKEKICEEIGLNMAAFTNLVEELLRAIWEAAA